MRRTHALPGAALLLAVTGVSCNTPFSAAGGSRLTPAGETAAPLQDTGETGAGVEESAAGAEDAATAEDAGAPVAEGPGPVAEARFAAEVRPILEQRCVPCHFQGGKMYERLPFDRPETIQLLGDELFTRIKADEERETIRAFLRDFPGDGGREAAWP